MTTDSTDVGLDELVTDATIPSAALPAITAAIEAAATKMVLNMFSTISMVQLGETYRTLMADVKAASSKLTRRAIRIGMLATGADEETARTVLDAVGGVLRRVIEPGAGTGDR